MATDLPETSESVDKSRVEGPEWAKESSVLRVDPGGAVRIGRTRVSLDSVVLAVEQGCSAHGILERFPSLTQAEVEAVIEEYGRHRDDVDAYLVRRAQEAQELRRRVEEQFPQGDIRERLLARRTGKP